MLEKTFCSSSIRITNVLLVYNNFDMTDHKWISRWTCCCVFNFHRAILWINADNDPYSKTVCYFLQILKSSRKLPLQRLCDEIVYNSRSTTASNIIAFIRVIYNLSERDTHNTEPMLNSLNILFCRSSLV